MKTTFALIFLAILGISSCKNKSSDYGTNNDSIPASNIGNSLSLTQQQTINQPRFSIVQSTLAAKGTFKLDSYTGDVYQLVTNTSNIESWQLLSKRRHSVPDTQIKNSKTYVLFTSTLAIRFTYLMNVNTGATWQFVQDPQTEENFFTPIE